MAVTIKKSDKPKPSWMKKGKAAQKAIEQEDKIAEQRKLEKDKLMRFWIPDGGDKPITFIDGALDEDGILDCLMWREHNVFMNGNWRNYFVCLEDEGEPCPLCESGNNAYLACGLSVIDHSIFKSDKGEVYQDRKRLFVFKRPTFKMLQKIATKRKGLAGVTFDVSRTGDKEPGVGNVFDYTDKHTLKQLKELYPKADWEPADYEKEINFMSAAELRKLGFGNDSGVGNEEPLTDDDNKGADKDYADEL